MTVQSECKPLNWADRSGELWLQDAKGQFVGYVFAERAKSDQQLMWGFCSDQYGCSGFGFDSAADAQDSFIKRLSGYAGWRDQMLAVTK